MFRHVRAFFKSAAGAASGVVAVLILLGIDPHAFVSSAVGWSWPDWLPWVLIVGVLGFLLVRWHVRGIQLLPERERERRAEVARDAAATANAQKEGIAALVRHEIANAMAERERELAASESKDPKPVTAAVSKELEYEQRPFLRDLKWLYQWHDELRSGFLDELKKARGVELINQMVERNELSVTAKFDYKHSGFASYLAERIAEEEARLGISPAISSR